MTRILKNATLLILIAACSSSMSFAQSLTTSQYVPNIIPPSPTAAALMKFSEIPVSPYTGTANITVPITTIKLRGLDVPVSIAYHTGGIRLKDEASWVGLGWALNAGGMVSRTIMGHDDFGTQGQPYFTNMVPQLAGDLSYIQPSQSSGVPFLGQNYFDFYCSYLASTTGGTMNFYQAFTGETDLYDMEPDIFTYNFPGHSGKFIITRSDSVVMQKQDNIIIQFQSGGQSFTITDESGNKFYFNTLEKVQTVGAAQPVSSWLLSKIVTQLQDSVTFNYTAGGNTTSSMPDAYQTYGAYCNPTGLMTTNGAIPIYYTQMLQNIDYVNGRLTFNADPHRSDLSGSYKLDSILEYSKNMSGTLTYLKQHNLYYSYFNAGYGSGADSFEYERLRLDSIKEFSAGVSLPPYSFVYTNPITPSLTAKHSFNVDHWGYSNGSSNSVLIPSMSVEYNPPNFTYVIPQILAYSGGNRDPNLEFMETFALQQVNYPTGGHTVIGYQANDYDYNNTISTGNDGFTYLNLVTYDSIINVTHKGTAAGSIDLTNIFPVLPTGSQQSNLSMIVAFIDKNNYTVPNFPYENSTGKLYATLTGNGVNLYQDINGATCVNNSPQCSANIPVTITSPGVYNWTAYIDPSVDTVNLFSEIHITFQYQLTFQAYNLLENNSFITPGGGLRVQNLTNYSSSSTIANEKVYSYNYTQDKLGTGNPQQYSFGRLMSLPQYVKYNPTYTNTGTTCTGLELFSSSITSLTSDVQGNIVGYDQVTETNVDPVTGLDIGKTVYKYYNISDTLVVYGGYRLPGTLAMGNSLNGQLLSKTEYANKGGLYYKVAETDNFFHTTNRVVFNSPKYDYIPLPVGLGHWDPALCTGDTTVNIQTEACFYPSIKSEKILLDSTYSYAYDQSDTTKYVLTIERNYYDNPKHYLVTRTNTTDSKGDTIVTKLKYAQDYPSGNSIIDTMVERNIVSQTLEKQDSFYYMGSSTGYITGAQLSLFRLLTSNNNTVIPDKTYKLDIQAPVTNFQPFSFSGNNVSTDSRNRQMISFDQYDANDNIQQYTTTDQNPVTIIWDYVAKYPIAQVKNAAVADVAATSFEADGKGGWTFSGTPTSGSSLTGSMYYPMSGGAISKSGLTNTTTYVVSYWTSNGSSYSISGTTSVKQGKTISGWTYFEHLVTGVTSVSISGTGNIDEVRLYPSTALMTTYTYSPLVGTTTICDQDNKVSYFFYDGFKRLKWIKDQDGNIIKTFQYHYENTGTTQY